MNASKLRDQYVLSPQLRGRRGKRGGFQRLEPQRTVCISRPEAPTLIKTLGRAQSLRKNPPARRGVGALKEKVVFFEVEVTAVYDTARVSAASSRRGVCIRQGSMLVVLLFSVCEQKPDGQLCG